MITAKTSPKIFTCAEIANLTGICAEHLQKFGKRHCLGFISRTQSLGSQAEQWLFTSKDLMVLTRLFQPCMH